MSILDIPPVPISSWKELPYQYQIWLGRIWFVLTKQLLKTSLVFDFPNIGAVATSTTTTSLIGVAVGDTVLVTPSTALEAGITVYGYVSAADTITLVASNPTAGPINPVSRTYYITVIRA
jgi:hypothetical protein